MSRFKAVLLSIAALIIGLGAGFVGTRYAFQLWPSLACSAECQNKVTPDHRFFSEELMLVGEVEGKPFLLNLDLNRKRVAGLYSHYYYADYMYGDQHRQLYSTFSDESQNVVPSDFLVSYQQRMAEDLSARESYAFDFSYRDLQVKASLPELKGDFIVKNTIDYTKYISEGDAQVTVNGKNYAMHAMVSKIYTPYYDKYVFFNGYNDLDSLAQAFVLWDEQGNMYMMDHSDVYNEMMDYRPHTWVLYKNRAGQYMKKAFSGNIDVTQDRYVPSRWSIYIPDLEASLNLTPKQFVTTQKDNGWAEGTVTTPSGTQNIKGYFLFRKYGDR